MPDLRDEESRTFTTPHKTPETPESRDLKDQQKDRGKPGSGVHADDVQDNRDEHVEEQLDHGLKETFPASDPVSINPGSD